MMHWYAFLSKPRKERLLCEQLRMRQIEIFFPCLRVQPVNPRAQKTKPYFPGYVFGRVDLKQAGPSILDWLPGAIGVVSFGGEPAPLSDQLVDTLRRYLDSVNGPERQPAYVMNVGENTPIQGEPFANFEAIFDAHLPAKDRVAVLLKILQDAQIQVELPTDQISLP